MPVLVLNYAAFSRTHPSHKMAPLSVVIVCVNMADGKRSNSELNAGFCSWSINCNSHSKHDCSECSLKYWKAQVHVILSFSVTVNIAAELRPIHTQHAVPMPFPCHAIH